jgi:predicted HTH transcriptional regulator
MEGMVRDDDTPQHKAVREAMTNCIIHADLMLNSVLKIEKYDDKFVFTNPGLLRLPVEQIYAGEETRARNQRIQNMFRMIGFGENLGSGFPLILSAWNEKHWLKPELIEQRELLQVKLVLSIDTKGVVKDFVKDFVKELSERQLKIMELIALDPTISAKAISEKISEKTITERTIQNDIAKLKELGILTRKGGRKNGEWVIVAGTKAETF